jgi:Fe2+ or Zn2+ uptake regulation protein
MDASDALLLIEAAGRRLTARQLAVLRLMAAAEDREDFEGAELVYERGVAYLCDERIAARTVFALLRACAIRGVGSEPGGLERYAINETGRALIAGGK